LIAGPIAAILAVSDAKSLQNFCEADLEKLNQLLGTEVIRNAREEAKTNGEEGAGQLRAAGQRPQPQGDPRPSDADAAAEHAPRL
jgi:hypothetical protein